CEAGKSSSLILAGHEDEHEIRVIQRDHDYEKLISSYVDMSLQAGKERPYYTPPAAGRHSILSTDLKEFLVNQGAALIEKGIEIRLKGSKHKLHAGGGKISLSVSSAIDWFDAHLTYHDPSGNASPVHIDPDLLSKGLLKIGDTYTLLTKNDIEKISKLYEEGMDGSGHLKISKRNLSLIDELYADITNKSNELQSLHEIAGKLKNFQKIKDHPLPRHFHGTLRQYQRAGYNWLCFLNEYGLSGCLADDMGLGKTVQALAFLQQLKEAKQLETSLLVVPVSTITNWEQEIERFAPRLKYIRHAGSLRIKDSLEHLKKHDLVIVSYQTLRNDAALFHEMEFDYIILDESQYIKNARSQSFKAVRSMRARHRLSLTGTPIENNTLELWAQMDFLNPGLLSSVKNYTVRFARPIETYGDKDAAARLRKTIYPFILRRKKEDVERELPEKELITMYSEMDEAQRMLYNQYRDHYREKIKSTLDEKGVERSAIEIFDALLRLRQIALFPGLVDEKHGSIESCKFETLKGMLDDILEEQHKVLIFSQFVKSLKRIEDYIKRLGYDYAYLDGSTKNRDREIKKFQDVKNVRVFLLSLKAGGVGINLTAADYVILFDPWWNPAVEMQAIDRAHRIGQTRKVIAYKMIVKDTVEEKILKLQEKKIALVNDLVREESSFFKSLSKNAIMDLFA
ncbi:MAG: DEAD/DEAH box helicase, partial [Pseudomonadota bacterium]